MSIIRLQHIGTAVSDFERVSKTLERLGLPTRDFRNDQGKGFQHDSRVLLGNECWLHIVHNWNPESRVNQYMNTHGDGLEHLALETDDIEADIERLRKQKIPIFEDKIFDANDGYEAFVFPEHSIGFTIELIQPHVKSWAYPDDARDKAVSPKLGIVRAHSVRANVKDLNIATERFETLFGLKAHSNVINLGNAELELQENQGREHLTSVTLASQTVTQDMEVLQSFGAKIIGESSFDSEFGFSVELVSS